jgi:formyl-CoA transferase
MEPRLPLADIRVLDLTAARAGPTCVRQFADWGADVIRIEPREERVADLGDRHGSDFQALHRNKRSLTLNLKSDEGRELFYRLVKTSDVVAENMKPQAKVRLGVDYETLRAINPRIVYGSISGYGQNGPAADRGGVDQIAQGMGGLMSITGHPGGGPVRAGFAVTDVTAGLLLAIGILIAIHERERTGEGRWVQTSLLEAAVTQLDFQAARWTLDHQVADQVGNHHPTTIPMGCYPTADGHINIAAWDGAVWEKFARLISVPEVLEDPRFATRSSRSENRAELNATIEEKLLARTTAEWVAIFDAEHVPVGPVYNVDQLFADPQTEHLQLVQTVEHPILGEQQLVRNTITLAGHRTTIRLPSPEVGEHKHELLAELGLSPAEVSDLELRGVV